MQAYAPGCPSLKYFFCITQAYAPGCPSLNGFFCITQPILLRKYSFFFSPMVACGVGWVERNAIIVVC